MGHGRAEEPEPANMAGTPAPARLHPDDLEALARRVAELLDQRRSPALLDRREAARHLRMGISSFTRLVRPFVTVVNTGGRPLYRAEDLDRWAAARSRPVPPRGVRPPRAPPPSPSAGYLEVK